MNAVERLLERVQRIEHNSNGCRIWEGAVDRDGYARTTLRENGERLKGVSARVHRHVLEAKVGRALTPIEQACHTCDVPGCVEASHLWVGSGSDNRRDAIAKGRVDPVAVGRHMRATMAPVYGDRHGRRKLSSEQVIEIRGLLEQGMTKASIAARYGVTPGAINLIATGKNWAHLP